MRKLAVGLIALGLGACSSPQLRNSQTAAEQFSKLSNGQKAIASNFYDLGSGDAVKRLYWAQRRSQEVTGTAENTGPVLQRKYVNVPYPPYQDADGTLHEGGIRAVEIVQLWRAVPSHGGTLFICR
jgi:hypothetical protein